MKWEKVRLSSITTTLESGSRPKGGAVLSGIPSLGAEHLDGTGGFKFNKLKYVPKNYYAQMASGIIRPNDILLVKDGATTGKVSIVDHTFPFVEASVNEHVFLLRVDPQKCNPKYCFYYLSSGEGQKELMSDFRGATVGGISRNILNLIKVPLPPLHIQEQIADTLDKADALRKKDQELLQKYDELAQAIFYDMFGDPVRNERGWECRELSDLAEIIMGQSPPGETYNSEGLGDPLLNGPTEFGELHPVEKQWTTSPTKFCMRNDILFCVRGATAGKLNVADKAYCIGRGLAAIRPKEDSLSSYLYLYLNNMYDVFQKTSDGSTFINISGDRLKSLRIPLLPESDLAKFQKMSEMLQEGIRVAKKSTDNSKMLFNGVMINYFS